MSNDASSLIYAGQLHHFAMCSYFFCQEDVVYKKEKGVNSSSSSSIISCHSWMSADKVLAAHFAVPLIVSPSVAYIVPAVMVPDQESK
eukprot:scaffold30830_cov56-Attheya_sp.AAC.2